MKKNTKTTLCLLAGSVLLLLCLSIFGNLLTIGDHLTKTSPILGTLFYLLVSALVVFGILFPILQVWKAPVFSLYMLRDRQGRAKMRWCNRLVANLTRNTTLSDEESHQLRCYLTCGDETDDLLISFFKNKFTPIIAEDMKKAAKAAFLSTAISQTALYDMLSMLSVNLNLIKTIVHDCGYRPSGLSLIRLYLRVLGTAFLAGGMEDMDLEELLPLISGNAAMKLPGLVMASAAQGLVNAFTTYRVGVLTRNYLFAEHGPLSPQEAKKESYQEALSLMKSSGFYKDALHAMAKKFGGIKEAAAASVSRAFKRDKRTEENVQREA